MSMKNLLLKNLFHASNHINEVSNFYIKRILVLLEHRIFGLVTNKLTFS